MTFSLTWDFHSLIPDYNSAMHQAVGQGVAVGLVEMAGVARAEVPVDTGSLQDTIGTELVSDDGQHIVAAVTAGDTVGGFMGGGTHETGKKAGMPIDYAEDVEYGNSRGENAQPFMTPAAEQGANNVPARVGEAISGVVI